MVWYYIRVIPGFELLCSSELIHVWRKLSLVIPTTAVKQSAKVHEPLLFCTKMYNQMSYLQLSYNAESKHIHIFLFLSYEDIQSDVLITVK